MQASSRNFFPSVSNIYKTIQRNFAKKAETAKAKVEKGKVKVEDTSLYWEKHGYGPHPVLFFPGLVGSIQTNYWPVFRKMDHSKYTMIGVDPEGYGKSRPPDRNPFIEEFCLERDARLAGEVMETLGYDRYSIVGWSNGGISASILAQLRPQNTISISLCNAPLKLADRNNIVMDQITNLKNWDVKHRKELFRVYDEEYATKVLKDWRYFIKRETENPHHFSPQALNSWYSGIQSPMIFIYGTKDAFMNPLEAMVVFEEFSSIVNRLRLIRNGSHFHLDFLDDFVEAISDFLDDVDSDEAGVVEKERAIVC